MNATCIWDGNGIKQFCTISAEDREKHVKFVVARENPDHLTCILAMYIW